MPYFGENQRVFDIIVWSSSADYGDFANVYSCKYTWFSSSFSGVKIEHIWENSVILWRNFDFLHGSNVIGKIIGLCTC